VLTALMIFVLIYSSTSCWAK